MNTSGQGSYSFKSEREGLHGSLEGGGKETSGPVAIMLSETGAAGKEMRMEVWKELGKEVSMEMGDGGKEGEEGDEYRIHLIKK